MIYEDEKNEKAVKERNKKRKSKNSVIKKCREKNFAKKHKTKQRKRITITTQKTT